MKREEAGAGAESRSHSALTHRHVRGHDTHGRPPRRDGSDTDSRTRTDGPAATGAPLVATGDTAVGLGTEVSRLQGVRAPRVCGSPLLPASPPWGGLIWDLTHNG